MGAACEPMEAAYPSRAGLAGCVVATLQHGRWRDPDVLLVKGRAGPIVVKDFGPRAIWLRQTLGRFLIWREVRAYRALKGHPEVPRLLGRLDGFAFAVEYRPGERMTREVAGRVSPGFASALEDAVRRMHDHGVAHLDLRHRSNVLVGQDGAPVLIDFASAICFRPGSPAARWLLPFLARYDLRAVEKWRARLLHVWPAALRDRELSRARVAPASPRNDGTSPE